MSPTRDATVAARIPHDLRQDLERVVELRRQRGETRVDGDPVDLSTIIRSTLRRLADAELAMSDATRHAAGEHLFAPRPGAARSSDPSTSKAAAADVAPRTGSQRRRALEVIVASGAAGATTDQVIAELERQGLNVAVNGVARRVTDLAQAGAIEVPVLVGTSTPVTRPTRHGSRALVYIATVKGRDWLNANRSTEAAA